MGDITTTASLEQKPFALRGHRPGDMGWIIYRHGLLYATEYNFSERFESTVARIAADFIDNYNPTLEKCWIAESTNGSGEFMGCVMVVNDRSRPQTAMLRLLLVEPSARGMGVGRALVRECIQFARNVGYRKIALFTTSLLGPARRIYESEGFKMVKEEEHDSFGRKVIGENWELELPNTEHEKVSQ